MGRSLSTKFAGRDVTSAHHHGAFQKPRLDSFNGERGERSEFCSPAGRSAPSNRRSPRRAHQRGRGRAPRGAGCSADALPGVPRAGARQEPAARPARYPACPARAGDDRGGGAGGGSGGGSGGGAETVPASTRSRSPTRACSGSPRPRTRGDRASCRASRTRPQAPLSVPLA